MPASQLHVSDSTPMGASLIANGATFRVWAPGAEQVFVALGGIDAYQPRPEDALVRLPGSGHWAGFFAGVADGTKYRFLVSGQGGPGFKRDPWARELEPHGYPDCDCIVRDTQSFPWHDEAFSPPGFADLIVYQLHVGRFYATDDQGHDLRPRKVAKLLDALDRVEYLADLGITAVQPLPLVEFQGEWSLGYNGTDLFSPEMDYCVDVQDLAPYVEKVNALLAKKDCPPLAAGHLEGQVNQLKAFIDVFHLYGIAVIADVVYNHAGGNLDAQSIDYFDLPATRTPQNNLYFSEAEWAGGRVFAFDRPEVRDFLIGNAFMFLREYHVDGLRFDEVSVIDANGGWAFCQELTAAIQDQLPAAVLIAEYWAQFRWLAVERPPDGMGFDIGYADGIRDGVRSVLTQVAAGATAPVDLGGIRQGLGKPWGEPSAWQVYNCLENHDLVLDADGDHRKPRIARLADASNPRSWYARSRARVAAGLLLSAPGIPMMFMGQEFLEDKLWSDNPNRDDLLIWWEGLEGGDEHMSDHHHFIRDLIATRRRQPALRSDPINVYLTDETNRVIAFHRWTPQGNDVVVVASLSESTFTRGSYALGFPLPGDWFEILNSDVYDHYPNPWVQGNAGHIIATGQPMHGLPTSAGLTIPANSVLVFAREPSD